MRTGAHIFSSLHEALFATRPTRVMLVEADDTARTRLASALRRGRYEVIEVGNRDELPSYMGDPLESCEPFDVADLIIADADAHGAPGLEIATRLRRTSLATPVILLASAQNGEVQQAADRLGSAYVFKKPFRVEALLLAALSLAAPK